MTLNTSANAALPSHSARGLDQLLALAAKHQLEPTCKEFYFLRHGQTPRNALRIFQDYDEPLSALGEQQALAAAKALVQEPVRSIICSDARRAHHTAQTVATALQLAPRTDPLLRERHFGALIGTSSAHIDWDCAPEGGETLAAFVARKHQALSAALAHTEQPVLIVAHGGSLYVLAALLHVPVTPDILANAHPLHFSRHAHASWRARALLAPALGQLSGSGLA